MTEQNYRHHHIVLVPVPVGGSQKTAREVKPRPYPHQDRQHWPPRQGIPHRASKAAAAVNLLRNIARQEAEVRAYMDSAREGGRHAE